MFIAGCIKEVSFMNKYEAPKRSSTRLLPVPMLFMLFLLFFAAGASAQMPGEEKAPPSVINNVASGQPQDIIVLFDDTAIQEEAAVLRRNIGADYDTPEVLAVKRARYNEMKQRVFSRFFYGEHEMLRDYSHLPMVFMKVKTQSGLAQLLERPEVVKVYENGIKYPVLAQSLPLIKQDLVALQNKKGAGTAVAVLDTGLAYTRTAFGTCTTPAPGDCLSLPAAPAGCKVACVHDFAANDNQLDDNGHGTNVSGIVVGVAPETKVLGLDVFAGSGAWDSDIINAIDWCIANKTAYNIVAINMSLGDGLRYTSQCGGDPFANPVSNAKSAGILSSIASGNETYKDGISSPACVPAAVSVGAVYDSNMGGISWSGCTDTTTAADKVTCFSNSASFLTMLAPGAIITAAGYNMGGTSQAAPHIAGSIAVLKGQNAFPSDTPDQTINRMTSTGVPVLDTRNGITKPRIDLLAATGGGGACTYSISPTNQSFGAAGGTGNVNVTTAAGCSWTAVSNAAWITITSGSSGSGDGAVNYSVATNSGSARTGTMTIAGQTFTVNQSGAGNLSISGRVTYGRGVLSGVTMTLSGTADKTTTTNINGDYIFNSLANGAYTVTPTKAGYSFTPASRTVTLSGASATGQNFSATLGGGGACTYSISPASQSFGAAGGTGSVGVTAGAGCNWTAASNDAWITITGGASGTGNGTVNYSVAPNTGSARTGTMTIAGQTFTVSQSAAGGGGTFSISGRVTTTTGIAVSGVTMTLSGASGGSTTTDISGNYTFSALGDGSYTVTPGKTGYAFTPANRNVSISGASVTGQNFTAARVR